MTLLDAPTPNRALNGHLRTFGGQPRLFQAPGRINIIGEHVDYADGLVMPAAIDRRCFVAAAPNGLARLRVLAEDRGEVAEASLGDLSPSGGWFDYVQGVAWMLVKAGHALGGADLSIASDVPIGAGVSSSAALEVAVARALLGLAGVAADGVDVARWTQTAENSFVGVPCGVMDQFASANGRAGSALRLDCRDLTFETVPLPDDARFLLVDSSVRHALVDGAYADRRRAVESAAAALGLRSLRDAPLEIVPDLERRLADPLARRARHVITEIDRVRAATDALRRADLHGLGALMSASHKSLRDDFDVSTPEVDLLQSVALDTGGVLGARMMGGGFGGAVIVLVLKDAADQAQRSIAARYGEVIGRAPDTLACVAVDGAGEIVQ